MQEILSVYLTSSRIAIVILVLKDTARNNNIQEETVLALGRIMRSDLGHTLRSIGVREALVKSPLGDCLRTHEANGAVVDLAVGLDNVARGLETVLVDGGLSIANVVEGIVVFSVLLFKDIGQSFCLSTPGHRAGMEESQCSEVMILQKAHELSRLKMALERPTRALIA